MKIDPNSWMKLLGRIQRQRIQNRLPATFLPPNFNTNVLREIRLKMSSENTSVFTVMVELAVRQATLAFGVCSALLVLLYFGQPSNEVESEFTSSFEFVSMDSGMTDLLL